MKRIVCLSILLALAFSCMALAGEAPRVALEITETAGVEGSYVRLPALTGGTEAQQPILDAINDSIRKTARADEYLALLTALAPGGTGLRVDCEYALGEKYLSVLITAEGKMLAGRPSQVAYPMNFSLETGETLAFDDLFTDADAARAAIEAIIERDIEPTLSTYLENNQLFPVPFDRFFLSGRRDVTFFYERDALSFLSGRPGAVSLTYGELDDLLDEGEGAPATDLLSTQRDLFEEAKSGRLAGLSRDVALGDSLETLLSLYPAASDSGYYPGGAYIETEDARLRGTYLIADENETVVTGILCTRYDGGGLVTGATTRDEWRALLGQPATTLPLSGAAAESYLLPDGESDYYLAGDRQIVLHADASGVLRAILLK